MGQNCRADDVNICRKHTSQYSDPRVHYPEECSNAKAVENCQYTFALTRERSKLFVAQLCPLISSVFTEQSQICAKNVTRAMIEQGDLHILLTDDLPQPEDLLQRYRERIEELSQQDRVSKFCTDAGFLTTVEVGQYFMTKDTGEFSQFTDSVACREYNLPRYTLPRDEDSSEPKGWIRGPALEVKTWSGNHN